LGQRAARKPQTGLREIDVLSIGGFALHFAWYLMTFLWIIPQFFTADSYFVSGLTQVVFLIGAGLGSILLTIKSFILKFKSNMSKTWLIAICTAVACLPAVLLGALLLLGLHPVLAFIFSSFLAGVVNAFFFCFWEEVGAGLELRNPVYFVAVSFCVGAIIFILCRSLFSASGVALSILAIIGSALRNCSGCSPGRVG
jgi:hypothetical protein